MRYLLSSIKWLYPGMRVKRWFLVVVLGSLLTTAGLIMAMGISALHFLRWLAQAIYQHIGLSILKGSAGVGVAFIALGFIILFAGVRQVVRSITSVVSPGEYGRLAEFMWRRRRILANGERIVVIGGGTGLATLLRGLKEHTSNITAVVTVTDDGGSSGRLVREFGVLPPGDVRNCIAALADEEYLMTRLLEYRFSTEESDLNGHNMGNLLLTALTQIAGSFDEAIRETSQVLAIRGRVLPSTVDHVRLRATFVDGSSAEGERAIAEHGLCQPILKLSLVPPHAKALPEVVEMIERASAIIIGPGSLYTSVIPNLLLPEIRQALIRSKAPRVYVCNVMTQPGETGGFSAADHVRALVEHVGPHAFDTVLVNQELPSEETLRRYAEEGANWVRPDVEKIRLMDYRVICGSFMNEGNVVRHNAAALARAIMYLLR